MNRILTQSNNKSGPTLMKTFPQFNGFFFQEHRILRLSFVYFACLQTYDSLILDLVTVNQDKTGAGVIIYHNLSSNAIHTKYSRRTPNCRGSLT